MAKLGIIFCANLSHFMQHHPEQPGRVINTKKMLEKDYKKYFYKAREYSDEDVIKFLNTSGFDSKHMNLISDKFDDMNSAYSTGKHSVFACILETKCLMTMCDLIKENKIDYAINIIRPPGHHCCNSKPGGFCLVNLAIVAATRFLEKYKKVNIFDIDLHHGGGTQKMMEKNKKIMYTSIHNKNVWNDGLYLKGIHGKRDRIINFALPGMSNDRDYLYVSNYLIREMKEFTTDMLILSMGVDAHQMERLVGNNKTHRMNLTSEFYGQLGNILTNHFNKVCVILEGGYNEEAIAESMKNLIDGLMGKEIFKINKKDINSKVIKMVDKM